MPALPRQSAWENALLRFLGDVGVYIPDLDLIKSPRLGGGFPIECYARRSAMIAAEGQPFDDVVALCATFEKHRLLFERVAADKHDGGAFGNINIGFRDVLGLIKEETQE
jgi:hypothetical protein